MIRTTEAEYVVFDVETTGLSVQDGDRIIEIGAVRMRGGKILDTFATFVDPRRPLNPEAMKTNKITEDMIKGAPDAADVLPRFVEFVGGATLVAHNASFDIKFVCYELAVHNRRMREGTPVVDSLKMAREFLPQLNSFRLESLAHALGVKVTETHRALADVQLLADVFQKLLLTGEDFGVYDLRVLLDKFGVEKPTIRLKQAEEASLF
jgi:DNA polymerase-3 subunit alpha (Gram-positive type)